jgi:hypothetical protein
MALEAAAAGNDDCRYVVHCRISYRKNSFQKL